MNPHDVFFPNPDCPARGRVGEGNITHHARTPPRYCCAVCRKTFGARAARPFHRRATAEATITGILTLVAHGCPIAAIVAAFGVQRQRMCQNRFLMRQCVRLPSPHRRAIVNSFARLLRWHDWCPVWGISWSVR